MHPFVDIVIVTFNNEECIEACVDSVLSLEYPNCSVILVDNSSTDNTLKILEKFRSNKQIMLVRNPSNLGQAEGSNIGARASDGKYIAFFDSDTIIDRHCLSELVNVMESDQTIGVAQAKIFWKGHEDESDVFGAIDRFGETFPETIPSYLKDKIIEISFPAPIAMIVRRQVFKKIHQFDPKLFAYKFEVDFGWRVWLHGYRCVLAPKALVYHIGGGTGRKMPSSFACFHNQKNVIASILKNYDCKNVLKYLPCQYVFQLGGFLRSILCGDIHLAIAKVKALLWILRNFKYLWKERYQVQQRIRNRSDEYLKRRILKKPDLRKTLLRVRKRKKEKV